MSDSTAIQTSHSNQLERSETFAPRSITEAFTFAEMLLSSGMVPKAYLAMKPDVARASIVVVLQHGMELGLQPMQALQSVANINGTPGIWGDAALALVRASGKLEFIREDDFAVIKENQKATCIVKRVGDPELKTVTFSYKDAQDAGIFGNAVWKTYPYRMCMMRARSFALRDMFPDVLKGMVLAEELQDYPAPAPEKAQIQPNIVVPQQTALPPSSAPTSVVTLEGDTKSTTPTKTGSTTGGSAPTTEPQGVIYEPSLTEFEKTLPPEFQQDALDREKAYIAKMPGHDPKAAIHIEDAKLFYRLYTASGHTQADMKAKIADVSGIDDSRKIIARDWEMYEGWAKTPKGAF